MTIRNRIVSIEKVKASELRANPKNWRQHPKAQREFLARMLADVGNVGVLTAVRGEDGVLTLLDGHLRADLRGEDECEVAILDLTPEEADIVLATFDPLATMAGTDNSALADLLKPFDSSSLVRMIWPGDPEATDDAWQGMPEFEGTGSGHYHTLRVIFKDEEACTDFFARLDLPSQKRQRLYYPADGWQATGEPESWVMDD